MAIETYKKWEIAISMTVPILTAAALLIGIWQFTEAQALNDRLEYKRRKWEKQLEVYMKTSDVVGRIAANSQEKDLKEDITQFEILYWGNLLYVSYAKDTLVKSAMIAFHLEVQDYLKGRNIEGKGEDRLKVRAKDLVSALQVSSTRNWLND